MGLLDDAIREHLEFKRQHGANPDEVARQEHEALGPVDRGDDATPAVEGPGVPRGAGAEAAEGTARHIGESDQASQAPEQDLSHTGQETAELDMSTVLKTEPPMRAGAAAEESLEWEVPGDSQSGAPGSVGGEVEDGPGEPVEDVLEETPDFLRETPDQDRLWFEQQPPRDFDFDK